MKCSIKFSHNFVLVSKMDSSKDPILIRLMEKKKELLLLFLAKSRIMALQSINDDFENLLDDREDLIANLKKNDEAIEQRESSIKLSAKEQDKELYQEIIRLLLAIQDNDDTTFNKLDSEKGKIGKELRQFKQNSKLASYLKQGSKLR